MNTFKGEVTVVTKEGNPPSLNVNVAPVIEPVVPDVEQPPQLRSFSFSVAFNTLNVDAYKIGSQISITA